MRWGSSRRTHALMAVASRFATWHQKARPPVGFNKKATARIRTSRERLFKSARACAITAAASVASGRGSRFTRSAADSVQLQRGTAGVRHYRVLRCDLSCGLTPNSHTVRLFSPRTPRPTAT
jgi:hypothetical protein